MRVYLHTFGCKANQYDTELMRQGLEDAGAVIVAAPGEADAAVINSCTVTNSGEAKMRGLVRRVARDNPGLTTVVTGCAAAVDDGRIASLPGVVCVVGGSDPQAVLDALGLETAVDTTLLRSFQRGSRAWLRIQDGCDEHCTFCATVLARGVSRSRPPAELAREARLLAQGHAEIVLTGVHIGTYGKDIPSKTSLAKLVATLLDAVPDVRFRLSSVEATEIDDCLADLLVAAPDRIAPHVHAPLQSGSDRVLKRMGRHWYTAESYRRRLEWLAERLPVFGLGADVIVGFPGESEADFAATVAVIESLPFTYLHVFPYSARPNSAAPRLGSPVDRNIAAKRSEALRVLVAGKRAVYEESRVGRRADVVLTRRRAGIVEGITEDYLTVEVVGDVATARFAAWVERPANGLVARPVGKAAA
ncbi:MAG: MiaB/RimO family radical SAM methylthiotransferase [Gemmatimonadales bacterium]